MKPICLFLLILSPVLAFSAETGLQARFAQVMSRLQNHGIDRVQDLDLSVLSIQARSVQYANYEGPFPAFANGRRSAFYSRGRVYSNSESFTPAFRDAVDLLAVHETLGALGYSDEDYQLSSRLILIMNSESPRELSKSPELQILFSAPNLRRSGGVTSVGGGGDLAAIWYKSFLLNTLNEFEHLSTDALEFANYAIEPADQSHASIAFLHDEQSSRSHRGLDRYIMNRYRRTGEKTPLTLLWKVSIPKSDDPQLHELAQKDIREWVKSLLTRDKNLYISCVPYTLYLPDNFFELEIVRNSQTGRFQSTFSKFCEDTRSAGE